jgi:threonine synthase
MVTDRQIKHAYGRMAQLEGIFAEPASAAGIAGLYKLAENGFFDSIDGNDGDTIRIVSVLTGHGLKDPQSAIAQAEQPITVDATEDAVMEAIDSQSEAAVAIS